MAPRAFTMAAYFPLKSLSLRGAKVDFAIALEGNGPEPIELDFV